MEANTTDPGQTAPMEQSDQGSQCLQYMLPKNISRRGERTTQVVTGGMGKLISFGIPIWVLIFAISAASRRDEQTTKVLAGGKKV